MTMLNNLIWDFDGTLFDTYPGMVKVFMELLHEDGLEGDGDEILDLMKVSLGHAIEEYGKKYNIGKNFRERFEAKDKQIEESDRPPYPFAREICAFIKERGGKNFLITHREDSTLKYMKYYDMENLFTEIVTREYGFKRKPDPEAFLYIINKYDLERGTVLGIGDRGLDIEASQNAGISTCLFRNHDISLKATPDFVVSSLEELYEILKK